MKSSIFPQMEEVALHKGYNLVGDYPIYISKGDGINNFPPSLIWPATKGEDDYVLKVVTLHREFKQEVRGLENVHHHQNIIDLEETYSHGMFHVLVEPYVGDRNLPRKLDSEICLFDFTKHVIYATEGIKYVHENNFIHHDLHQDNIRIESGKTIVIDFQLANKNRCIFIPRKRKDSYKGEILICTGPIPYYPNSKSSLFSSPDIDLCCLSRIIDSTMGETSLLSYPNGSRWFTDKYPNSQDPILIELGKPLYVFLIASTSKDKKQRPKNASQLISRLEFLLGDATFIEFSDWVAEEIEKERLKEEKVKEIV